MTNAIAKGKPGRSRLTAAQAQPIRPDEHPPLGGYRACAQGYVQGILEFPATMAGSAWGIKAESYIPTIFDFDVALTLH
jgi:hypothetical protein